jgi:hypothetical protein
MPKFPRGHISLITPKIFTDRLGGLRVMSSHTSGELYAMADKLEAQIGDPRNHDDSKWLKRWSGKCRWMAAKKEKAIEHKRARS